ncbi:hypothetical protein BHE74_00030920 [Ensete ventricosum]|nr:hypothetical protein BHE74_00030920 [Ensete ventricosum]
MCWISTFGEKLLLLDNSTVSENRTDEKKTLSLYEADWGAAGVSAVGDECQRKPGKEEEGRALSVTSYKEKGADDWKGSDCGEQATAEEECEERKCRSHRKGREDVTPSKGV